MINVYEFIPGSVAALLYVRKNPMCGCTSVPVVYLSKDKGAVWGRREHPLYDSDWPVEVKLSITQHFNTVFSLEHETWKDRQPSPRAVYVDNAKPWQIQVEEQE